MFSNEGLPFQDIIYSIEQNGMTLLSWSLVIIRKTYILMEMPKILSFNISPGVVLLTGIDYQFIQDQTPTYFFRIESLYIH